MQTTANYLLALVVMSAI